MELRASFQIPAKPAHRVVPAPASRNFILRHWRGEYPLRVACWRIAVGLSLVLTIAGSATREMSEAQGWGLRAQGALMLAFYLLRPLVAIWMLVGVWRSARAHKGHGGEPLQAVLAMTVVVLATLGWLVPGAVNSVPIVREGISLVRGIDEVPEYSLRLMGNGTELALAGGLRMGVSDAVGKALAANPGVQVIRLDSPGGRVGEAKRLAGLIEQRRLSTYTDATCARACVLVFLAGKERYLGEQGRLGFYRSAVNGYAVSGAADVAGDFAKALKRVGASPSFIEALDRIDIDDLGFFDVEQLQREHVIDAVIRPGG
ncbi:hypothetical protein SJI00_05965 [Pseudomonas sp. RP23018S]|uniref:hypothetical protein n=1 Tax=Pseudomonas sp. RP23018S TaxID=3096037 RepID=UPI002ACAC1B0|nr:hypothetical protein [Pseudomonas sp. RP23018S]MDZ5602311.1 hypothetical protein [Pseudomonas sp. RP23018S]